VLVVGFVIGLVAGLAAGLVIGLVVGIAATMLDMASRAMKTEVKRENMLERIGSVKAKER
jgi:ABC-type nitrate/sulfonate/bicarbonate transport system permease component